MKFEGLYTALITPFDSYGKIDTEGLRSILRFQLHHVQGVVLLGTTGEAPTLTSSEKQEIIKIGVEELKGKTTIIIGTGSYSTEQTVMATKQAQEMGADAVLIVIPYYNKPTQEGIYRHFEAICRATSIPICVYNIQSRTSLNLHIETLKRLISFPSIIGIKESSGDIMQIADFLETVRKRTSQFGIVSGDDALTLPLMALGGHGIISVVSNLIPGAMKTFVDAILAGDFELARNWHYELLPFFKAAFFETNPIPIKTAMQLCGMPSGHCRLPLCELMPQNLEKLKEVLQTLPCTWIGEYGKA